jgi:hypothetical protein
MDGGEEVKVFDNRARSSSPRPPKRAQHFCHVPLSVDMRGRASQTLQK